MPDDQPPEDPDDPSVEDLRARIDTLEAERDDLREQVDEDKDETIGELRERITALESDKEDLEADLEPVEDAAVEAMSREKNLPEDMVREKFDVGGILDVLAEDDTPEAKAEALSLSPDPQTGDPDPTDPEGGSMGDLSEDDQQEVESLASRAETFDGVDDNLAESLRADAASLAGVEDFDDLEGEVV